jgi:hypothetical protein
MSRRSAKDGFAPSVSRALLAPHDAICAGHGRYRHPARLFEQLGDPPVAIAPILGRQRQNCLRQPVFVGSGNDRIALGTTVLADDPAGLAFRELILLPNPLDSLPASLGAYKFPEEISFSTCFSSDRSATSRFSRTFSFSRSFIRRA